jgi:hypothetical protein
MGSVAIPLKAGEAKTIIFTITDSSGDAVNCFNVNPLFEAKVDKEATAKLFSKVSGDFDFTFASTGILSVPLLAADTAGAGDYVGELKLSWSTTNIDKSHDIGIFIDTAITT